MSTIENTYCDKLLRFISKWLINLGIIIFILQLIWINIILKSHDLNKIRVCADFNEPIDVVYTWVNGSDPDFIQQIRKYRPDHETKAASRYRGFSIL